MGKVEIKDNYRASLDGEEYTFNALTDRQAWYLAYEWSEGELLDTLEEIDEYGNTVRVLLNDRKDD